MANRSAILVAFIGLLLILNLHQFGMILNWKALELNNFKMPVFTQETLPGNMSIYPSSTSQIHVYYNDPNVVNAFYLTDIFLYNDTRYSIGDLIQYTTPYLILVWVSSMSYFIFRVKRRGR